MEIMGSFFDVSPLRPTILVTWIRKLGNIEVPEHLCEFTMFEQSYLFHRGANVMFGAKPS